jgi:undecaprenyl-diphosphatase
MLNIYQILILSLIQGACELLPVSSSAHVIVAEKLMGLDPSSPELTMLLVMMHTGTMFSVIFYFWKQWWRDYLCMPDKLKSFIGQIIIATMCTAIVGYGLKEVIERVFMKGVPHAEVENLFDNLPLIAGSLATVGIFIIYAGMKEEKLTRESEIGVLHSIWIGLVQGICLPFRGFSRSGATISTGLVLGLSRQKLEEFSFALAVVLTPPVVAREAMRLIKAHALTGNESISNLFAPSVVGMMLSFCAGLVALKWLTRWLETGLWKVFGFYCLAAAAGVVTVHVFLQGH